MEEKMKKWYEDEGGGKNDLVNLKSFIRVKCHSHFEASFTLKEEILEYHILEISENEDLD